MAKAITTRTAKAEAGRRQVREKVCGVLLKASAPMAAKDIAAASNLPYYRVKEALKALRAGKAVRLDGTRSSARWSLTAPKSTPAARPTTRAAGVELESVWTPARERAGRGPSLSDLSVARGGQPA